jgi:hypothetical protein
MHHNFMLFVWITLGLLLGAGLLHLLARMGQVGEHLSEAACRAPLLDVIICYFAILPLVVGPLVADWSGLIIAIVAQFTALLIWQTIHEATHRDAVRGPRIIKALSKKVGPVRYLTAAYMTALATPVFWVARAAQIIVYPSLVRLVNLPAYNAAEWVNVSRQKFSGLVGHDLIWCLYCDWMTGVWSLGTEMLRNVESWACPIRFSCEKKCANCAHDFPDINNGWVDAAGNMADVVKTLDRMYPSPREPQVWYGHPLRKAQKEASSKKSASRPDQNVPV